MAFFSRRFMTLRRLIVLGLASLLVTIVKFHSSGTSVLTQGPTTATNVATLDGGSRPSVAGVGRPSDEAVPIAKALNNTSEAESAASSILDESSTHLSLLECPSLDISRYAHLNNPGAMSTLLPVFRLRPPKIKYFFVLNLRSVAPLLPRLLGSIVSAIRFLGPSVCAISIVEGNSDDNTWDILSALKPGLISLGLPADRYTLVSSDLDPSENARIERLAMLRNLALAPVGVAYENGRLATDAHVVFLNDVAACTEDILELLHQRVTQQADMTCAMDWVFHAPSRPDDPADRGSAEFYDIWIARTMSGDSFFHIPPSGAWDEAWNLFPNTTDALTRDRYSKRQPFQVYSCWNGGVVLTAAAVAGPKSVRFRVSREGEAFQGEPTLWCKDMWRKGLGRIAVVPSVNLEYTVEKGQGIKRLKGFTSNWTVTEEQEDKDIKWQNEPPEKVRSWIWYHQQEWRPWREPFEESDRKATKQWKMYPGDDEA